MRALIGVDNKRVEGDDLLPFITFNIGNFM
jgi:hypothetical protein